MIKILAASLIVGSIALALPFVGHRHGYNRAVARASCALWAVAISTFTYWLGYTVGEGAFRKGPGVGYAQGKNVVAVVAHVGPQIVLSTFPQRGAMRKWSPAPHLSFHRSPS